MANRTIPRTASKSAGQLITGALWNAGPLALNTFLTTPPIFRGRQNTAQAMASGSYIPLSLDLTDVDSDNGHSNVTNNSRYTAQVAGWYFVAGYVAIQNAGATSRINCTIAKNGSFITGAEEFLNRQVDLQAINAMVIVSLNVGDYVETWGYQSGGSTINTFVGSDLDCCMNVFWISQQ